MSDPHDETHNITSGAFSFMRSSEESPRKLAESVKMLEQRCENLTVMAEAMWELLAASGDYDDEALQAKIAAVKRRRSRGSTAFEESPFDIL
jgi:hypothetical protein